MKKEAKILDLSNFVVTYFNTIGENITRLKLQKLMYYIQAWHLTYFDHPLFNDEPEAWVNGPVYKTLYNSLSGVGDRPLTIDVPKGKTSETLQSEILNSIGLDEEQKELLNAVLQKYGLLPTFQLVYLTHAEDPWNQAREGLSAFEISDAKISHDSMKKYYKSILEKRKN